MVPLSRLVRTTLLLSTLVAAAALPQAVSIREAKAQTSEKKKVAVGAFDGDKKGTIRDAFIESLKSDGGYEVTDAEDVKHSAKDKAIATSAKNLLVDAVITGEVKKTTLTLKVRKGADGSVVEEVSIKGGSAAKLKKNVEKTGASSVASATAQAVPEQAKEEEQPAESEEANEGDSEEAPAEEASSDGGGEAGALSPLEITAGLRPYHRTFAFHDTLADVRPNEGFGQLLRYELPLGPALFIDLNLYPASFVTKGPAEWFGLTAGFEKGFATESVFLEGQKDSAGNSLEKRLKTDMQQWYAGLRVRIPVAAHAVGLSGVYGQHTFGLLGDDNPLIPDVKYSYVRAALDAELRFGELILGARVGKRFVSGTGGLEDVWFPNVSTQSLEAGATVGYQLVSMLDLVAGFDWLRYAFDFNPVPMRLAGQESFVAGGATDEYISGYLGLRFHLPPSSGGDAASGSVSVE